MADEMAEGQLDDRPSHERRERADSFGSVAADYDRFRPSYPDALFDALLAAHPAAVLDIGCGTGKATRQLADRGVAVLGLEPDPKMAEVARGHGLDVEVGRFETWDDAGRRFDLITAAQAWHWVDPSAGAATAARLLRPGGALALFWNHEDALGEPNRAAATAIYERLAPQLLDSLVMGGSRHLDQPHIAGLRPFFGEITTRTFDWTARYTAEQWVGLVSTHSDHLMLGAGLPPLLDALSAALTPTVEVAMTTYLIRAAQ